MSGGRHIASRDNPLFRELLGLAESPRERKRAGATLIEGIHLCEAFLDRHGEPRRAVVAERALADPEVGRLVARLRHPPDVLADALFRALSAVEHGIGIAFIVGVPAAALPDRVETDAVYLDRLQDPGNVGTILRTCAAVGIRTVIAAPGTAACWAPKVLRAGMGAHFHLDIHESVPWAQLAGRLRVEVLGTAADGAVTLYRADLRPASIWLFGREGEGLAPELAAAVGRAVSIPQAAQVESLNVGVAAAVCLYEQLRQRRFGAEGA